MPGDSEVSVDKLKQYNELCEYDGFGKEAVMTLKGTEKAYGSIDTKTVV